MAPKVKTGKQAPLSLQEAVKGQVVTRFPPEPSGYLHIGHAKAAILNLYSAEMYEGKLIVRFDDTNPSKEKLEYQNSIIDDLKLLGIDCGEITFSSNYFNKLYDYAIQLIKLEKAYCDDTPVEQMRSERMEGIASKNRDLSVERNLELFEEMKNATEAGLKYCLRAKISVDSPNKALRDPVIYRCNILPHHRTGSEWKMYPTYDFCCPIVDSIEGVTHALRTLEYRDRNAQYKWFIKQLSLRSVFIWDFSRLSFVRTLLSKRKLQAMVDKKIVTGWDDPRFPTIQGVIRRGMTIEGLRQFIISQGPSKNSINLDWTLIWAINKKIIDPVAPRLNCVIGGNVVCASIEDDIFTEYKSIPLHKKNSDIGEKNVEYGRKILIDQDDAQTFKLQEEITLMDWGNAIVSAIEKNEDEIVTSMSLKLHLEGDFKTTERKVTWICQSEGNVKCNLIEYGHLITKDKLEETDNWEDFVNPQSMTVTPAIAEQHAAKLALGDIIQFQRKGYYRLDKISDQFADFILIPDGKTVVKYGAKQ